MQLRAVKIPLRFLITGIIWAIVSDPLITFFFREMDIHIRDIIRSGNDFAFVGFVTITLYFSIKKQQHQMAASENQYRRLFELNPGPMWIFNINTLQFVKVNKAALELYGYSENEFLSMTTKDIRPKEEQERFLNRIKTLRPGLSEQGTWTHLTKGGERLYASVVTYELEFNGEPCRLTMANNVTDLILKEERIKAQNAALHEIAWLNSHEVRRALCSVISLTELVKDAASESERREYTLLLQRCTNDLDDVLKKTNSKVDELKEY